MRDGRGRPSEDRNFAVPADLSGETGVAGVLDGHSGAFTVDFTTKVFPTILSALFENYQENDEALKKALQEAFINHDKLIAKQGSLHYRDSGSTASIACIGPKSITFASIGDSPMCIIDPDTGKILYQVRVHTPEQPDENRRILRNGGHVTKDPGDAPRVNGCLMVSRAFGDFSLKFDNPKAVPWNANWATDFCVTADPEITTIQRPTKGILAIMSDGLVETADGDGLKPLSAVATLIHSCIKATGGDLNKAAELVLQKHMAESAHTPADYDGDDLTLLLIDVSAPAVPPVERRQVPTTRRLRGGRRMKTGRAKKIPKTFTI